MKKLEIVKQDLLMSSAISKMDLNLTDTAVLTEAASGAFSCTCLMAALAGAKPVFALAKDSEWGTSDEVISFLKDRSRSLGIEESIQFITELNSEILSSCNLVTNSGFVRPLNYDLISKLPNDSVISLMCEPWEVRNEDVDLEAARRQLVPVAGTNEQHELVRTFEYLGPLLGVLLNDAGEEINGSSLSILASEAFCDSLENWAISNGARKVFIDTPPFSSEFEESINRSDFLVIAHMGQETLRSEEGSTITPEFIKNSEVSVFVIAGDLEVLEFRKSGVRLFPEKAQPKGKMWITTAAVDAKPVIDLQCAGLKVGELLLKGVRSGMKVEDAVQNTVKTGYGLPLSD